MKSLVEARIEEIQEILNLPGTFSRHQLEDFVSELIHTIANGKKIAFVGNGGSAAEALHIAAEFTGKCVHEHKPVAALCLNESISAITAIGNDFGFSEIFSRQVDALMESEDILVALSTSGKSPNILRALEVAKTKGIKSYLWTGMNDIKLPGVQTWNVPSNSTPRIQEVHLMWGHIIAEAFEIKFNELEIGGNT
jgi:D-sedoheptulose 7-phosphate isomerase